MCVNDVICCGAKPLFFLDYIACGKNIPERIAAIVEGVAEGCVQSGAALIGGETAEMPGFYPENEYDLAGFAVGVVDREKILRNDRMEEGDVIIALPSSGVHSNGFSLVRRVFGVNDETVLTPERRDLFENLLTPTKIYVKPMLALFEKVDVRAVSHITGGGFYENIPRSFPKGMTAKIEKKAVRILPIFERLAAEGKIPERDMFNTFNMGVGMSVCVPKKDADLALSILREAGEDAYIIGEAVCGDGGVELCCEGDRKPALPFSYRGAAPICRRSSMQKKQGRSKTAKSHSCFQAIPKPTRLNAPKRQVFPPFAFRGAHTPSILNPRSSPHLSPTTSI